MNLRLLANSIFGALLVGFILILAFGSLSFYADLIQGLDWKGISFYTLLILAIVWKLSWFLQDAIDLMISGRVAKK